MNPLPSVTEGTLQILIKLRALNCGDCSGFSHAAQCDHKVLTCERGCQESTGKEHHGGSSHVVRKALNGCCGFEDGRGPLAKDSGQVLHSGNEFFSRASRKNTALRVSQFFPMEAHFELQTFQNCEVLHLCYFKPQSLWELFAVRAATGNSCEHLSICLTLWMLPFVKCLFKSFDLLK